MSIRKLNTQASSSFGCAPRRCVALYSYGLHSQWPEHVHMFTHMCAYMSAHMPAHMPAHVHMSAHMSTHMFRHLTAHTSTHITARMSTHTANTFANTRAHACTHACTHLCTACVHTCLRAAQPAVLHVLPWAHVSYPNGENSPAYGHANSALFDLYRPSPTACAWHGYRRAKWPPQSESFSMVRGMRSMQVYAHGHALVYRLYMDTPTRPNIGHRRRLYAGIADGSIPTIAD